MKRYIRSEQDITSDLSKLWRSMSGSSQMAVEYAYMNHDSGQNWDDAIRQAVYDVGGANVEPEFEGEDFYGEEANEADVRRYIELREGVSISEDTDSYHRPELRRR